MGGGCLDTFYSPLFFPLFLHLSDEWSGGATALGNFPVPGRPTIWMTVGQGPAALVVGAGGAVWTFLLSSVLSLLCLPLFGLFG